MYHEEKIIDGVLHWRGTPDGQFKPYTNKELTTMYTDMREQRNRLNMKVESIRRALFNG